MAAIGAIDNAKNKPAEQAQDFPEHNNLLADTYIRMRGLVVDTNTYKSEEKGVTYHSVYLTVGGNRAPFQISLKSGPADKRFPQGIITTVNVAFRYTKDGFYLVEA